MSYSSLATYRNMTGNKSSGRGGNEIVYIAIHHMAGNLSVAQCGSVFQRNEVSAHYGINGDDIGVYVDESDTAWALGNFSYNQKSINIELANDGGASTNWHVSDETIETCIKLVADIAYRLGWTYISYTGDLYGDIIAHRWIASTTCPGPYMMNNGKLKYIAQQADKLLKARRSGASVPSSKPSSSSSTSSSKLDVDGLIGTATISRMQKWLGTYVDGVVSNQQLDTCKKYIPAAFDWDWSNEALGGSPMVKALQKKIGVSADGYWGHDTSVALQKFLNSKGYKLDVDGIFGEKSAKALQRYLNSL